LTLDSTNLLGDAPREERFSENGHNLSHLSPDAPEIVTTPLSWEVDGLEIEYMPEGE
jgi:hypothetical protein